MNHDQIAPCCDKVLNLLDLLAGVLLASNDRRLISFVFQNLVELAHNACPICILIVLDRDANLLAAGLSFSAFIAGIA